jgi:hypothetical protein
MSGKTIAGGLGLLPVGRRSAQHDQVICVSMIGLPSCVRELKIDLLLFVYVEKGKS